MGGSDGRKQKLCARRGEGGQAATPHSPGPPMLPSGRKDTRCARLFRGRAVAARWCACLAAARRRDYGRPRSRGRASRRTTASAPWAARRALARSRPPARSSRAELGAGRVRGPQRARGPVDVPLRLPPRRLLEFFGSGATARRVAADGVEYRARRRAPRSRS